MVFSPALFLLCATASWLSGLQSLRRNSLREEKFLDREFFFADYAILAEFGLWVFLRNPIFSASGI